MLRSLLLFVGVASLSLLTLGASQAEEDKKVTSPLDFKMKDIDGKDLDLGQFKGKVVLMVNVASFCGYTPQYQGLQALYEKYKGDGLVVIGVPANEFGRQEPGTNPEIKEFCTSRYRISFPMLGKVVVKGEGITPLYAFLTGKDTNPKFAGNIGWNFEKFLIDRKGEVVNRFKSSVKPQSEELEGAVKAELEKK